MEFGPANQAILQTDLKDYMDTLHDILRKEYKRKKHQELMDRIRILPGGWSTSVYLIQLQFAIRWHSALAQYGASSTPLHDLYLVSTPHTVWPASFKHWSLYSQSTFFHLILQGDKPYFQIDRFTIEQLQSQLDCIDWQVRCDNVHRLNTHVAQNRHIPMIAFNIGQTQFSVAQIECLAQAISEQFEKYTKWEQNCQLFALSISERVVMTKGVGTIFVGTRAQIAHWDTMATNCEHSSPFSQEEGYLLRDPSHGEIDFLEYLNRHTN